MVSCKPRATRKRAALFFFAPSDLVWLFSLMPPITERKQASPPVEIMDYPSSTIQSSLLCHSIRSWLNRSNLSFQVTALYTNHPLYYSVFRINNQVSTSFAYPSSIYISNTHHSYIHLSNPSPSKHSSFQNSKFLFIHYPLRIPHPHPHPSSITRKKKDNTQISSIT
ncbi:hypothetical protein V8C42DRAFT_319116 [Trichoderma barbatum]